MKHHHFCLLLFFLPGYLSSLLLTWHANYYSSLKIQLWTVSVSHLEFWEALLFQGHISFHARYSIVEMIHWIHWNNKHPETALFIMRHHCVNISLIPVMTSYLACWKQSGKPCWNESMNFWERYYLYFSYDKTHFESHSLTFPRFTREGGC